MSTEYTEHTLSVEKRAYHQRWKQMRYESGRTLIHPNSLTQKVPKTPKVEDKQRMSIYETQQKLQNLDLDSVTTDTHSKNKGFRGQLIERALGIPNSSALTDLSDGELKSFTIGQTIAVTQLMHCLPDIQNRVPYNESKIGIKMQQTIIFRKLF